MNLFSIDIFDTTLYRKCGEAENVFALLALRLYPHDKHKRDAFFTWRRSAPSRINNEENKYASLSDIYNDNGILYFSEFSPMQIMQMEMDVESEMLTVNPAIKDIVSTAREKADTIAFISDMYLPVQFLKGILLRECIWQLGDRLYVSCEEKARKDDGTLYAKVKEEINPSKWTHYGDNDQSDIFQAKKYGINAIKISIAYNDVEQELIENSIYSRNPQEVSTLAGFSKHIRLLWGNDSKSILAADFVAPCYVGYMRHVLNDASRRGISTLFFLSRDSYILMKIAEILPHEGINLKYLFVSRRSLITPFLYNATKEQFLSTLRHNSLIKADIDAILQNLGLTRDDIHLEGTQKKVESEETEKFILDAIFSQEIRKRLGLKDKYELCSDYLKQEGVYDENIALVDVGWLGSTRLMINEMRKRNGVQQLFTYYYGIEHSVFPQTYGDFDYMIKGVSQNAWNCFVVEDYFSACHYSTTVGYMRNANYIVPIFKGGIKESKNAIEDANIPIVQKIAKLVGKYNIPEEACYTWALNSYKFISDTKNYIDYSFFAEHNENDEFSIRKLSKKELWHIIKGDNRTSTTCQEVALDITLGRKGHNRLKKVQKLYFSLRKIFWLLTLKI